MSDDLFEKYRRDRDRHLYHRIVEVHRPLVESVCRRLLRDANDVDDVVQETFLKLSGHIDEVNSSLGAWLTATARAASVDFIRRAVRERNRRQALAKGSAQQAEYLLTGELTRARLPDALLAIEPSARELLTERFARKLPLRVLAAKYGIGVPGVSRRVAAALRQLAHVLREMHVPFRDDQSLADHLGDPHALDDPSLVLDHASLRFAPDWRSPGLTPFGMAPAVRSEPSLARTLRIGALVSYASTRVIGQHGKFMIMASQVGATCFFQQPDFQLVAVVESGSDQKGIVERTLREHSIIGGLIDVEDEAGLATLDVLLLGINWSMTRQSARAINQAVRGGMGLLNEYWIGSQFGLETDPYLLELNLADSFCYAYHTPPKCGLPLVATAIGEHPLLPGLKIGTRMPVSGCGPAYRVLSDARVLIAKELAIPQHEHGVGHLGTLQMPCYIVGGIGRGRVVVNHLWPARGPGIVPVDRYELSQHLDISREDYFSRLLRWLARSHDDQI